MLSVESKVAKFQAAPKAKRNTLRRCRFLGPDHFYDEDVAKATVSSGVPAYVRSPLRGTISSEISIPETRKADHCDRPLRQNLFCVIVGLRLTIWLGYSKSPPNNSPLRFPRGCIRLFVGNALSGENRRARYRQACDRGLSLRQHGAP